MTDRNELERLLATIDAAKRLVYGLPVSAIRSDTHGNKMALWCDNGLAGVGQVCVAVNVGEFPDEQLTGIASLANCAIALRNNAQHYLSLMDEVERLREALADATEALADIRQKPYAPWPDPDPEDTFGSMIDNQAWVMMSHIASFIGHRDGQPDLMEQWQDDWAENYPALLKGWFSPHRAAAKYIADRLTIRRQALGETHDR